MNENVLMSVENVSKKFYGVNALNNIDISINEGEVHALVGENGAGKSTLIKILSGDYKADNGKIIYKGSEIKDLNPAICIDLGISTVNQELKVVETLTVAENIYLGRLKSKNTAIGKNIDWKSIYADAEKVLNEMGVAISPYQKVEELSVAKKQIVEICKAISRKSEIIIMDEPSATLTGNELEKLFEIIRKLKKNNIAVIYISHRLEEIFEIADRVTVLRDGFKVSTQNVPDTNKEKLIKDMVGRELKNIYPDRNVMKGNNVVLEVRNLNRGKLLHDINFKLYQGEILGIFGLVGAGRTEMARAILGIDKKDTGEVYINNKQYNISSMKTSMKLKMALIPEERKTQGIIPDLCVGYNITLAGMDKVIKNSFISSKIESEISDQYIEKLKIVTRSNKTIVKDLSGGNQQKCVIAKWLLVDSNILFLDEPTRGIDVGAKQEIYKLMNNLVSQGKSIVLISSELPEILGVSNRILVLHDGKIKAELHPQETNPEEIMYYSTL